MLQQIDAELESHTRELKQIQFSLEASAVLKYFTNLFGITRPDDIILKDESGKLTEYAINVKTAVLSNTKTKLRLGAMISAKFTQRDITSTMCVSDAFLETNHAAHILTSLQKGYQELNHKLQTHNITKNKTLITIILQYEIPFHIYEEVYKFEYTR